MNRIPCAPMGGPASPQLQAYGPAPVQDTGRPLARMPLQVGTSSSWNVAGAAFTLLPAVALTAAPVVYAGAQWAWLSLALLVTTTLPLILFALGSLQRAHSARASDLYLFGSGIVMEGGIMHGRTISWSELVPPYAVVEQTTEKRFQLRRLLLGAVAVIVVLVTRGESGDIFDGIGLPWKREELAVWRLWIATKSERVLAAETEDEGEAESMRAAAESIQAVITGQRYVKHAPAVQAQLITCGRCGAPVVPEEGPYSTCAYCRAQVPMPPYVRQQVTAARANAAGQLSAQAIVGRLLRQPRAGFVNLRTTALAAGMFLTWIVAWIVVIPHVQLREPRPVDVLMLVLPMTGALGLAVFSRSLLSDRGALRLLTLGFGALAPRRAGEPSTCRRCFAPLPETEFGGVVACRYCGSDNVVGLDLRPVVGVARAQNTTLTESLARRTREKWKWGALTGLTWLAAAAWVLGLVLYLRTTR